MNKKWLWIVLGVAVLLFSTWFFWYRHYQDRQKFERIEITVNELSESIASTFNSEIVASGASCYRASRKFEAEPLYCQTKTSFRSVEELSVSELESFVISQPDIEDGAGVGRFRLLISGATCVITKSETDNSNINMTCLSEATRPHYELAE
ncbi:MAG TPA: hypothetical protein VF996_01785 [Candidatus Saccharimonadales bacterium]|jgi:hypothetical protein